MKSNLKVDMNSGETKTIFIVAIATIITVFCLVSAKALWSQAAYNRNVLAEKRQAQKQLDANTDNVSTLETQYEAFNSTNPNAIGGANTSNPNPVPPDGNNSRVVLDALPTSYDFPALISSVTKIMTGNRLSNPGVAGSDMSATISSEPTSNPQPVEIPISISGTTSYSGAQNIVKDFERSIRPFDLNNLQLSGTNNNLTITASMKTYFQPAKVLSTGTKEVK